VRRKLGSEMGRETASIQENPRGNYKALRKAAILARRQRYLPTFRLSCGNQSAHISLVNRRFIVSLPLPLPDE
jgi:hypothetical protein